MSGSRRLDKRESRVVCGPSSSAPKAVERFAAATAQFWEAQRTWRISPAMLSVDALGEDPESQDVGRSGVSISFLSMVLLGGNSGLPGDGVPFTPMVSRGIFLYHCGY